MQREQTTIRLPKELKEKLEKQASKKEEVLIVFY